MKRIFIVFLWMSLFVLPLRAQTNFVPGYVVKNEGDTIRGTIDYRNWEKNPKTISFMADGVTMSSELGTGDISSFGVANEIYVSAWVDSDISNTNVNSLDSKSSPTTVYDQVFLQTLINGEKSLYLYLNQFSRENFYIKDGEKYRLLVYKKYNVEKTEVSTTRSYVTENKMYLGQLSAYLGDCPEIKKMSFNTSYNKESLIRLFESYYTCIGTAVEFKKETEKAETHFGGYVGASATSLVFTGNFHPTLTNAEYPVSINPTIGGSFEVIFARNLRKWSLFNELGIAGYQVEGSYSYQESPNEKISSNTKIGYTQLRFNSMVRYTLYEKKASWFVNAGLATGLAISSTNEENLEIVFFTTTTRKTQAAVPKASGFEVGYLVGTGFRSGRFSTEIRYENGNGMSRFPSLASTTHKVFLLLGFRFSGK